MILSVTKGFVAFLMVDLRGLFGTLSGGKNLMGELQGSKLLSVFILHFFLQLIRLYRLKSHDTSINIAAPVLLHMSLASLTMCC